MKKIKVLASILFLAFIFVMPGPILANSDNGDEPVLNETYEKAEVIKVDNVESEPIEGVEGQTFQEQVITVKMLSGDHKGQTLEAHNTLSGSMGWDLEVKPGDKVILYIIEHDGEPTEIYLSDMSRVPYVNYLIIFFMLALVVVGGIKGIKALVALGLTILGVYKILLPALLQGNSPLLMTVLVLIGVTLITMVIIAGVTKKAVSATLGTIGGVVVAGILALLVGDLAHFTGYASEESRMLLYVEGLNINVQGLLFAGIIIGALGAAMDVAISIASAIEEIKKANPELTAADLMRAGMNVGRDVMGTMANTLILAYTGGALPLLILFMAYDTSPVHIFNSELIATEIVRAVAGSIGLVFCIPITAFSASLLFARNDDNITNGGKDNNLIG